jgi:hypothetical protein
VKEGLGFAKLSSAFSGDTFNENMSLLLDLKDEGIRVNAISPGVVPTPGYDLLICSERLKVGFEFRCRHGW